MVGMWAMRGGVKMRCVERWGGHYQCGLPILFVDRPKCNLF